MFRGFPGVPETPWLAVGTTTNNHPGVYKCMKPQTILRLQDTYIMNIWV